VWINQPPATLQTATPPQTTQAALCLIWFDRFRAVPVVTRQMRRSPGEK
jgi:hypothetical protein